MKTLVKFKVKLVTPYQDKVVVKAHTLNSEIAFAMKEEDHLITSSPNDRNRFLSGQVFRFLNQSGVY